jgi:hypothetical protein
VWDTISTNKKRGGDCMHYFDNENKIKIGDTIYVRWNNGLRPATIIKMARPLGTPEEPIRRFKIVFQTGSYNSPKGVYRDETDIVFNFGPNPDEKFMNRFKKLYHNSK